MKTHIKLAAVSLLLSTLNPQLSTAFAQGTGFTYQGRLNDGASGANGTYDVRFAVYDALTLGTQQGPVLTNSATAVSNGLFTVTLDFGNQFPGANRWLEIAVRTNGSGAFTPLAPRQPITRTPYAIYAGTAGSATSAVTATTATSVPAAGIGAGTANINISGNASTATSAAVAGTAVSANTATTANTAASATTATTALTALTAGTATNLLGNVPDALLSTNIARLNGANVFTATNRFSSVLIATNPANQIAGVFTGSGAGLTGLSAISIAPGSITAAMLAPGAVSSLGAADGSPTNAMQVDTNGLVGIGTSTPAAGLQITTGAAVTTTTKLFEVQDGTGSFTNLNGAYMPAVSGSLLAVSANGDSAVTLVTMANPPYFSIWSQIRQGTGVFTNLDGASGLAWAGSNLVVAAQYSSAVTIISAANPASPVKLAELRNGVGGWNYLNGAVSVAVAGNLLAIGAQYASAVTLADISNPSAPVLRSSMVDGAFGFTNLAGVSSVALSGNLLAIGAFDDSAVTLVNVSNPANPVKLAELRNGVGAYTNLSWVQSVAISGNLLAIAAANSGTVTLVDVSNPASPVKLAELRNGVGGYPLDSPYSVALAGNRLAIAAFYSQSVTLVDVSNPANPVLLTTHRDGLNGVSFLDGAAGVAFAGTNLVVTGYGDDAFTVFGMGTQSAGLVSAGWVGIGTTHPVAALNVVGNVVVENANLFSINATHVALGQYATASGDYATALGFGTTASGSGSTALGSSTTASGGVSTALGYGTTASGMLSTAMGDTSVASGYAATALGYQTTASGFGSTAMGGFSAATNSWTLAAGYRANANHPGAFVWADSMEADFASTATNQFAIRASGGVLLSDSTPGLSFGNTTRQMLNLWGTAYGLGVQNNTFYTRSDGGFAWFNKGTHTNTSNNAGSGGTPLMTLDSGGNLRTVTGTLSTLSDRHAKTNFEPVNARAVLEQVAALPITRWNFKSAPAGQRHIGPMAQDFYAAFSVGLEETGICTVDADGVALAAIQGLNQKLEQKLEQKETEIAELRHRLEKLERTVRHQN